MTKRSAAGRPGAPGSAAKPGGRRGASGGGSFPAGLRRLGAGQVGGQVIKELIVKVIALALVACGGPEQEPLYGDGQPGHQPDGLPTGVCRPVCDHRRLPASVEYFLGCHSGILVLEACPNPNLTVDMCIAACNSLRVSGPAGLPVEAPTALDRRDDPGGLPVADRLLIPVDAWAA